MLCKDSDAFALEKYMDELLEFNYWKDTYQLALDLQGTDLTAYSYLLDSSDTTFTDCPFDYSIADFIDTAMKKLCFFFPMKYEFCSTENVSTMSLYKDRDGNVFELPPRPFMYKRKLGFSSIT